MAKCEHCGQTIKLAAPKKKKERRVCYYNAYGKPVYFSAAMEAIMDARARGEFKPVKDWLPHYLAAVPLLKKYEQDKKESGFDTPEYTAAQENWRELMRHVFN